MNKKLFLAKVDFCINVKFYVNKVAFLPGAHYNKCTVILPEKGCLRP